MRTRVTILAVVLCAALAACSDDGDQPDAQGSKGAEAPTAETSDTTTVDCLQFAGTSEKLAQAQAALYGTDAAARTAAIQTLADELSALKDDAPDKVDDALDTLTTGFQQAAQLMADPESGDPAALTELAPKLAEAGQTVTNYIVEQCQ